MYYFINVFPFKAGKKERPQILYWYHMRTQEGAQKSSVK